MKICIVLSSGGSVVRKTLGTNEFRELVHSIVTDREGAALEIAREFHLPCQMIPTRENLAFSDSLLDYCRSNGISLIVSFHLRLYEGKLLDAYRHRIINFHPSLLPAFAGFRSFERALEHGVKVLGTTVHFIEREADMGLPILQTTLPNDPQRSIGERRHALFLQQCRSLVQVALWFRDNRIIVADGDCRVSGASYSDHEYVPALDSPAAIGLL